MSEASTSGNSKQSTPDNHWCIYKHTCPDGEVYIGITGNKPQTRWQNGNGYKESWFYRCGIQKFGWENISHEILETNLTKEQALEKEHDLIIKYSSWCPGKGFNDNLGGVDSFGSIHPVASLDLGIVWPTSKKCAEYFGWKPWGISSQCSSHGYEPFEYRGHTFQRICAEDYDPDWTCVA